MQADLNTVKSRQQSMWATGDYATVAPLIVPVAEDLAEAVDFQAGSRVLDVATGSGNAAIAAARRNAVVIGLDYVPELLQRARIRAEAEDLGIAWIEGDAENLPFDDGSFDVVLSVFGAMFAPDHRQTAQELVRVCRRGGRIGLCNWTPDGFIGELFKITARYNPPPPGIEPPSRWGTEEWISELFAGTTRLVSNTLRTIIFRFPSPQSYVDRFRAQFGPIIKAFEAAGPEHELAMSRDIIELVQRFDRNQNPEGPVAIKGDYLETILERT